jgi:hypothetical protein
MEKIIGAIIGVGKSLSPFLLDCYTFCQVSRLVNIRSPLCSDVIGKEL